MDKGISFPLVRGDSGFFRTKSGIDLIKGNVLQILGTIPGERVMEPEFGSKLRGLIFEHIDLATMALAKTYTIDAIKRWEKRIDLLSVEVRAVPDESTLAIRIAYRYKETGESSEMTILMDEKGGTYLWGN